MKQKLKKQRYYCKGFSLTELIVVLGIVAIFAAISVPAISANIKKSQIKGTSNKVANWISGLRQKSINEQIQIVINKSSGSLIASASETKSKKRFRNTSRTIPSDVDLSLSGNSVTLFPTGIQTPSTIRLKNKDSTCIIRLALRGRITSECV